MRYIRELRKKTFFRNVLMVATGTAAAQLLVFVASPFITRLYGPEAFGLLGTFTAIIGIVGPIAALSYPIAIVLPKQNSEAISISKLAFFLTLFTSLISLILVVLFDKQIDRILEQNNFNYTYLIPLVIFFAGIVQIAEQWLIRTRRFKVSAKATFFQSLYNQTGKLGLGLLHPFASSLIFVQSFTGLTKILIIFFLSRNIFEKNILYNIIFKEKSLSMKKVAKKYSDFPVFRAPEVCLNAASQSLPIILLSSLFGPSAAGFYTICRTVLALPTQLIGKSVSDVLYPRIAQAANKGENVNKLLIKATWGLVFIGLLPFGLIILFGPWLFSFIFGEEWVTAGEYARWIALWSYCGFLNRPSVVALPVIKAQSFHLKFTFIMLITRVLSLVFGYYIFEEDLITIAIFGVTGAILNIMLILKTNKLVLSFDKNNIKPASEGS